MSNVESLECSHGGELPDSKRELHLHDPLSIPPWSHSTHHIGQLRDGHFKIHRHRIRNILHRPDEPVVLRKQFVEQSLLRCTARTAWGREVNGRVRDMVRAWNFRVYHYTKLTICSAEKAALW